MQHATPNGERGSLGLGRDGRQDRRSSFTSRPDTSQVGVRRVVFEKKGFLSPSRKRGKKKVNWIFFFVFSLDLCVYELAAAIGMQEMASGEHTAIRRWIALV